MPKRFALGTNLGLFARRLSRTARHFSTRRSRQVIQKACMDALESRTLMSVYYVSTHGSNSGNGSFNSPYLTIQQAANVANWGDTVEIEGGDYRETVTPAHSGVTFTNYDGQSVTILGTNQVSGFYSDGNGEYTANNVPNLGQGNNQVFVDGTMMGNASYPASSNPAMPSKLTIGSYSNGTIYNSSLNQPNGYWDGAEIDITPGDAWVSYVGEVYNSGPGWVSVWLPSTSGYEQPTAGNNFYLFGTQNALTSKSQFFINSSNQLTLIDQYGDNPNNHDVEVQARQYGFQLSGVTNTTINGVNLWGCTIDTGGGSSYTTIKNIQANFLDQFANEWGSGWSPPQSGIILDGYGDELEDSTIGYSAGDGVYVGNTDVSVLSNTIHDVDWSGTDAAGIRSYTGGLTLEGNTIYNCGRDGINFQGAGDYIEWNTIDNFMLDTTDGGGIYTVSNTGGGVIAYNTVYNAHNYGPNVANGFDAAGILLDNSSANFSVYNNTVANVDAAFKANGTSYNEKIYNNKLSGTLYSMQTNGWTGFEYSWSGSNVYDNVWYNSNVMYGTGTSAWGNSYASGSPLSNTSTTPAPPPPAPASPPPPPPTTVVTTSSTGASSGSSSSSSSSGASVGPGYSATGDWSATAYAKESNVGTIYGGVGYTYNGSWLQYDDINFGSGLSTFKANLAVMSPYAGQKIEVFVDSMSSNPIAVLTTSNTGSWDNFQWQSTKMLSSVTGTHTVYIEFVGALNGIANLMNWQFS